MTSHTDRSFLVKSFWPAAVLALLAGCAAPPAANPPEVAQQAPAERAPSPAEEALAKGVKLYQAAQYAEAETQFKLALQLGLSIAPDRANAHKYLAFVYCTSKRESLCAAAFKAARQADPAFALSKSETGHPLWGPVYRKALPATAAATGPASGR